MNEAQTLTCDYLTKPAVDLAVAPQSALAPIILAAYADTPDLSEPCAPEDQGFKSNANSFLQNHLVPLGLVIPSGSGGLLLLLTRATLLVLYTRSVSGTRGVEPSTSLAVACFVILREYLAPGQLLGDLALGCFCLGLLRRSLLNAPIKYVVVLESFSNKEISEELSEIGVVWLVIEAQGPAAVEIDCHLGREASAQELSRSRHLLLHDAIVLLLFGGGLESLPRERTSEEVHQNVAQGFEVVTTGLLCSGEEARRDVSMHVRNARSERLRDGRGVDAN